jgi:hypothetical protein
MRKKVFQLFLHIKIVYKNPRKPTDKLIQDLPNVFIQQLI